MPDINALLKQIYPALEAKRKLNDAYDPYSKGYYVPNEIGTGEYNPAEGGRREQVYGGVMSTNPNIDNPFKDFDYFKYEDMSKIADELASKQSTDVMRRGRKNMGNLRLDTAERLASQGVTGGSYFDTAMSGAEDRANSGTIDQLSNIDTSRMGQTLPMMNADNEMGLNVASAGANIDLANLQNTLKRLGLLQGQVEAWESSDASKDFDWGKVVGNLIGAGGDIGVAAVAASDRRFKNSIVKVGTSEEGIPIVEFEYNNIPDKKFRGAIAQDVEKIKPEAVIEDENGYKYVDYNQLSIKFEEI
jgi:hypothetical protein